jgi:hypothetical protein
MSLNELEVRGLLASNNLGTSTWINDKGVKHVSLTRIGRYNKNIAIPVELLPAVIEALQIEAAKIQGGKVLS